MAIKKALRDARPRTVAEIANAAGMDYNRLSNLKFANVVASEDEISAIRRVLGLPAYWPDSPPHLDGASAGEVVSLSGVPLVEIPVVGSVAAGPGVWNVDTERRVVRVPASLAALGSLGFIVDGDSMMGLLHDLDTAVFRESRRAKTGYNYLIKTPQDGFVVKKMVYDRGDWRMVSLNPKYPSATFPEGGEVHGLLVGYYRVNGRKEKIESDADGLILEAD